MRKFKVGDIVEYVGGGSIVTKQFLGNIYEITRILGDLVVIICIKSNTGYFPREEITVYANNVRKKQSKEETIISKIKQLEERHKKYLNERISA